MSKLENFKQAILANKSTRVYFLSKDFYLFCSYYFQENFYYPYSEYHRAYADSLWLGKSIIFIGHRESAKTTFARWYIIWLIVYGKSPFILWSSYDLRKSKENIYYITQYLIENKKIVSDFGHLFVPETKNEVERKKIKSVEAFISENGVLVRAIALKASTRWLVHSFKWVNHRPTTVIFDDIDTDLSVRSREVIDANYKFLKWEVLGGLSAHAQRIILGNTINEDGLMPRLEKDYCETFDRYRVPTINYKEWSTIVKWEVRRHNIGQCNRDRFVETKEEAKAKNDKFQESTWLAMKPFVSLELLKEDLGTISFWQNHLLQPYVDGTTIVKDYMIKRVESMRPRENTYTSTLWIDPAFSEKTNTDAIGLTITRKRYIGRDYVKYVIYSCELRWVEKALDTIKKKVRHLYDMYGFDNIVIESNNWWELIGKELRKEKYAVEIVTSTKDKLLRLREYETDFERWLVYFQDGDNTKSLVDQLLLFPNVENDDLVDSMVFSFKETISTKQLQKDYKTIIEKYSGKSTNRVGSAIGWKF